MPRRLSPANPQPARASAGRRVIAGLAAAAAVSALALSPSAVSALARFDLPFNSAAYYAPHSTD
jgi:hypothetical protein